MSEPARLDTRIRHLDELGEVVGAMRTLAASHVQHARRALAAIERYTATVEQALARVVPLLGDGGAAVEPGACAWLLLGGEHGFCGDFATRLVTRLAAEHGAGDVLLLAGSRAAAIAPEHGLPVDWSEPMVSHADDVLALARDAVDAVYERILAGRVRRLALVHGETTGSGAFEVRVAPLLPLDLGRFRAGGAGGAPLLNIAPATLVEQLVDEYVLARVVYAATASLVAENSARLLATGAAADAIAERTDQLRGESRRLRQAAITAELAELIGSGAFEST